LDETAWSIKNGNIQARVIVMHDSPLLYRAVRWIIALVFIYAGGVKMMDPEAFAVIIGDYGLIPESLSLPLAVGLPVLEIAAGLGLLLDVRGSLAIITGLIILFMAVLGYGLWLGLDIDCGCFAPGDPEAEYYGGLTQAIYRDVFILLGIIYLYWWRIRHESTSNSIHWVLKRV
jgi:uncharacterized membrane protein YphA (DoxX/SURF4 family)